MSIDVAHFINHGFRMGDQGALALAESPLLNRDRRSARFVGADELNLFLDQIGAWGALFSAPLYNYSPIGLRLLADKLSLLRPGTVMHHEMELDQDMRYLSQAYHFLAAPPPQLPPASPALIITTEPYRTSARPPSDGKWLRSKSFTRVLESSSRRPEVTRGSSKQRDDDNVPGWISATERFLESSARDIEKIEENLQRNERSSSEQREARLRIKQEVLSEFEERLAEITRKYVEGGRG